MDMPGLVFGIGDERHLLRQLEQVAAAADRLQRRVGLVLVAAIDDRAALLCAIAENVQRTDMSPFEEGANRLLPKNAARQPGSGRAPEFRYEALMQQPDLGPVVIDHPLSTLSDAKSDRRAEPAVSQWRRIWLRS
jgi:hypothetical protein